VKITNNYNLPSAFVSLAQDDRPPVAGVYHATELIKPTTMSVLERRHYDELTKDASDCVWLVLGSAVHKVMEEGADGSEKAEMPLSAQPFDYDADCTVTGRLDLYNEQTMTIKDYKTATVAKVTNGDFEEWRLQGLIYDWLLRKNGRQANRLEFYAMLKDWSPHGLKMARLRGEFYPEHAVWTWSHEITEQERSETDEYIKHRVNEIEMKMSMDEKDLPPCSEEERWSTPTVYAVMKEGRKTAVKLCATEDEAKSVCGDDKALRIEVRPGEDKRCNDYCLACKFCPYHMKGEK
jgi:hypothetical protein